MLRLVRPCAFPDIDALKRNDVEITDPDRVATLAALIGHDAKNLPSWRSTSPYPWCGEQRAVKRDGDPADIPEPVELI